MSSSKQKVPANPLIDGVAAETLSRLSALQTWLYWHPLRTPVGGFADHVQEDLRAADFFIQQLIQDALDYESQRSRAA